MFEPLTSCMPLTAKSSAPAVTYIFESSCDFKSDWVNLGNHLRWIFVRNAVKCSEIIIFTVFTAITAFLTKIRRIRRISYKNLPKNLDGDVLILCKLWLIISQRKRCFINWKFLKQVNFFMKKLLSSLANDDRSLKSANLHFEQTWTVLLQNNAWYNKRNTVTPYNYLLKK